MISISETTAARLQKAKERYHAARDALVSAQTQEIKAARELSDASKQWEHEWFAAGGALRG